MSLIFFEGFETLGTNIGVANSAELAEELRKRMVVTNLSGDASNSAMFLTEGENGGFAWKMGQEGSSFGNTIQYALPTQYQVLTGPLSPTFVVGFYVFIPSEAASFQINFKHDGAFEPNLRIVNSADLQQRVASNVIEEAKGVFSPGFWYYVEWRVKADGTGGQLGTATITDDLRGDYEQSVIDEVPYGPITTINISDVEMYLPLWDDQVAYNDADEIRWRGIEYTSTPVLNPDYDPLDPESNQFLTNQNKEPGVETEGFWLAQGEEQPNTVTDVPFGSVFFFENDPTPNFYTVNSFNNTSTMSFSPAIDGNTTYFPEQDEVIRFGSQAEYEARVNGVKVLGERGVRTMIEGNVHTLEAFEWGSDTSNQTTKFIIYDDLYVLVDDGIQYNDFLGPVKAYSLPPNISLQENWQPSSPTDDHTLLIRQNETSETTFVFSEDNAAIDEYEHTPQPSTFGEEVFAVKVECRAINPTAGTPKLKVTMKQDGATQTQEQFFPNTGSSDIMNVFYASAPSGAAWTFTTMNEATIELQMFNGFGVET